MEQFDSPRHRQFRTGRTDHPRAADKQYSHAGPP
jgi:hypothetical protein